MTLRAQLPQSSIRLRALHSVPRHPKKLVYFQTDKRSSSLGAQTHHARSLHLLPPFPQGLHTFDEAVGLYIGTVLGTQVPSSTDNFIDDPVEMSIGQRVYPGAW